MAAPPKRCLPRRNPAPHFAQPALGVTIAAREFGIGYTFVILLDDPKLSRHTHSALAAEDFDLLTTVDLDKSLEGLCADELGELVLAPDLRRYVQAYTALGLDHDVNASLRNPKQLQGK